MNKEIKIITLGDIFKNIETEDKAFEFLKYIKNLQNKITNLEQETESFRKLKERYQLEKETYKLRIDKAIEYIKEMCWIDEEYGYCNYGDDLSPEHIVNILTGGDEE